MNYDKNIIRESIKINNLLIKQPFQDQDIEVNLSYNILDYYNSKKAGQECAFKKKNFKYNIDRTSIIWNNIQDWSREVVWYLNSTASYMYRAEKIL